MNGAHSIGKTEGGISVLKAVAEPAAEQQRAHLSGVAVPASATDATVGLILACAPGPLSWIVITGPGRVASGGCVEVTPCIAQTATSKAAGYSRYFDPRIRLFLVSPRLALQV